MPPNVTLIKQVTYRVPKNIRLMKQVKYREPKMLGS